MTDEEIFEQSFDDFTNRMEYDAAENALFSIVRIAFTAGWLAAKGKPPKEHPFFAVIHKLDIPKEFYTDIKFDGEE